MLITLGSVDLQAQVLYGTVVGTVQDQTGALVPNATVILTNRQTGQVRETKADDTGNYTVLSLMPGTYDVKVSATGFRTVTQTALDVVANQSARADFRMEVGQVTEQINVEASAVQLQTERSDTQTTITERPIQGLPLNLYRNYQALINLVPGTTPAAFQNSATDTPGGSLRTNVNGTPANMNTTRLDGAINVNIWLPHHTMYTAPSEAVQEVNVSTSAMDAEQGMAGGAAITVITKSGTNDLHGSAWEYHNNQRMRARSFFMRPEQEKPRDTLNIFGATIGGPVVKNKLFYFFHYEGTRQRTGGNGVFDVPSARVRGGDFSNLTTVYDPLTGNPDGSGRTAFPGNVIPANRISPIAQNILQRLPQPNVQGAERQNYATGGTGVFDRDNYDYKINYNPATRYMVWGKSSFLKANVSGLGAFGELIGPQLVQDPGTGDTKVQIHGVGHNITLTPNLLLDQNFGITRLDQTVFGSDYGTNWGTEVFGIPGTNVGGERYSGLPNFTFGYSAVGLGATWMPMWRNDRSYTHDTNLSWVRGRHEFRFGYNMIHHQLNHWQPEVQNPRGNFDFDQNITWSFGAQGSPNSYNQMAAFLLGLPSRMQRSLQHIEMTGREWQHGWYVRDRWQVNQRLTLNLGLRFEYYPLMTRADSGLELFDPETNTISLTGRGNIPTNEGLSINNPLWAPRVGFAFRLNDRTVIRSGYGLTWDPLPFSRPLRGFYPLTVAFDFVGPNTFTPFRSLAEGIPPVTGPDVSQGRVSVPNTADVRSPWGKINRGYIQSWNFTIEREWFARLATTFAYVGTQTTNQLGDRNINVGPAGITAANLPYAQRYGRRIAINMWDGWMSSNYHSFQFGLNRQFANGFLLKGAYTWSKAINMTDDNGWVSVNWNWEPMIARNRATAGYDRTHVFQMAYVWELPFGKGRRWAQEGPLSWIVGGWGLNGVVQAFSGTPFTITSSAALDSPGNLQTANVVREPASPSGEVGTHVKWLDAGAFAPPAARTFGNGGRNNVRGPGRFALDQRLSRTFPIGERVRFEIMGEAFNLTNTPWFMNPVANVNDPLFGSVTSVVTQNGRPVSDRQFRVGARLQF
ncbi:MAG TPA: TonB-dependent receptor [Bryobacteraceae bacterium]|nr:TonB-dependent receptor [Bryobacteraceae bacterium]